jgi:photosystem II stability/assembly factor-like uncharacterized protein
MKRLFTFSLLLAALWSIPAAQSWTPVSSGTNQQLLALYFVNPDTGWIAGDNQVIRKTTNAGVTWTSQSGSPGNTTVLHFVNPRIGWAVGGLSSGGGFILKTTNGGDTWTSQGSNLPITWGAFFLDSLTGWIACEGGAMRKTTDGGANWTPLNTGTSTDLQLPWFKDASTGWVVGVSGLIRKTTNGGTSWTAQTSGTSVALGDLSFINADTGWVTGWNGTILKTTNGGANWVPQTSGTTQNLHALQFINAQTGYAAGDMGTIVKTTNGGANWIQDSTGTTTGLTMVRFNSTSSIWAAGKNGIVLKKLLAPHPSGLRYSKNPAAYGIGSAITPNVPSVSGTSPFTYAVTPDLPAGLSLNPSTGVISGNPTQESAAASYVITVTNGYGATSTLLNLSVVVPPSGLSYSSYPAPVYVVGSPITPNTPSVTGTASKYAVSRALPAGLNFDTATGVISGTPSAPSTASDYTFTASNAAGSTSITLNITVLLKPANLSYSMNPAVYTQGAAIIPNAPSVQGSTPFSYAVNPALPAGLSLNASTGILSGTPSAPSAGASYTVTVSNQAGSATAVLSIAVNPPSALFPAGPGSRAFGFQAPGSRLGFAAPAGTQGFHLEILSPRGALVRASTVPGLGDFYWDGKGIGGKPAPAGIYLVRLKWLDENRKAGASVARAFAYLP